MTSIDPARALDLGRTAIQQEVEAIQSILDRLANGLGDAFCECAQVLSDCPGLIWVTGVGTSAAIGARFAHILTDCGSRSMFLSPSDGLHGHSAVMSRGDVLVAISRGGESSEVNQMVDIANGMDVTTVCLVHTVESTLGRSCNHVLPVQSEQEYELMGFVATTSTVVCSAMCDALSAVVLQAKGYTLEQLGRSHPGGAVGRALAPDQGAWEGQDV